MLYEFENQVRPDVGVNRFFESGAFGTALTQDT